MLGAICLAGGVARAADGDAFRFSLGQSLGYESNLYRLDDGTEPPGGARDDTVSVTRLSGMFERTYGRQGLRAGLDLTHTRFAVHDELDHTGPRLRLGWDWGLGKRWSGVLAYEYDEKMADFEGGVGVTRNINRFRRSAASADYWWHPDWATGVGVASIESRFKDQAVPESEYDSRATDLNLTFRPASGNRVVLTLRNMDGRYINRPDEAGSIREYRQQDLLLSGHWLASGAVSVSGYLGQTRRSYQLAPARDFSGTTGRLTINWVPTGKSSVRISLRREVGAETDVVANYAVTKAFSVAPAWAVTDKIRLGADYEYRQRDFGGNPVPGSTAAGADEREDQTRVLGLSVSYRPMRALTLGLRLQRQQRDSRIESRQYEADSALLSGEFSF